jgi:ATP/ADP translocase/CRP-like cAMP-binding protein
VQLRAGEAATALLMFGYSFLAMAGYNMIRPVTRGLFIEKLGAQNLPWVLFGSGIAIGLIMQAYTRVIRLAPRRWMIPITLTAITLLMATFYLLFDTLPGSRVVAVVFYLFGLIVGILLISQFWTLANDVYDPRQAKRVFGFIGAGASLGGFTGAQLTSTVVQQIGTNSVLLVSAATLAACTLTGAWVIRREPGAGRTDASRTGDEQGVGGAEAIRLLRSSRHLQVIAMVIAFAAFGSAIIEQQLNSAAAESRGAQNVDAVTAFLAQIIAYYSLIGFVIQIALTSRIHRSLGIGFALLILPVVDSVTGLLMLLSGGLWTAGVARVADTSLRYTVDKTTREVLFLPLPLDIKYRAKPFIDVTVDRVAKGLGALLLLVLVQPWGLHLRWQQLSYASLTMMGLWAIFALSARREYVKAFRRSIERQDVRPAEVRTEAADPATVETLVAELAHPEPKHVLYAIDLLEALGKRHLVTPLLLNHESAGIRQRVLAVVESVDQALADRWVPGVQRVLTDADAGVRVAAVKALASLRRQDAAEVMRPYLASPDPMLAIAATVALASAADDNDVTLAEDVLRHFSSDVRDQNADVRQHVARALGDIRNPRFRALLVPLMFDANVEVAQAAIESAGMLGTGDFLFVPPLVSLLRHRRLKAAARNVLVGYGQDVVAPLAYFMRDQEEDVWIRRHVPATLALLPSAASVAALLAALDDKDGFLRFKAMTALARIRREHPEVPIDSAIVTRHIAIEAGRSFNRLTLHYNLFGIGGIDPDCLLARTLDEKRKRARGRVFALLSLTHEPNDIAAVKHALDGDDARARSRAAEYLDNLLAGEVRKRVMVLADDMPLDERVRRGNAIYRTRTRDVEDTVAQLLHDEDQSIASASIHLVEARKMWSLVGDLEYVLAHRDARDLHVFEAASWALAAHRMVAEKRMALWQEPLPAIELADRLRRIPMFDFTSVDEFFRIAALGHQERYEAGRVLYEKGAVPSSLQFLLDGRAAAAAAGRTIEIAPPAALAFEEVLEGSAMTATVQAVEPSITLSLTTNEFLALLAENVELAAGIFRLLISRRGAARTRPVVHGELPPDLQRKGATLAPIDRVLLLQSSPLLAQATAAQLWRCSTLFTAVSFRQGEELFSRGHEAALFVVLTGSLSVEPASGEPQTAKSGDMLGVYETLGGAQFGSTVTATEAGAGLKCARADLFDLIADNIDLLQGISSGLLHARAS